MSTRRQVDLLQAMNDAEKQARARWAQWREVSPTLREQLESTVAELKAAVPCDLAVIPFSRGDGFQLITATIQLAHLPTAASSSSAALNSA